MKIRAVILAGGEGTRLKALTTKRAKPAVPFAGKYRIIDFTLSNCVNSQITDVMVLAQYRPQSLIEHIGSGSPWDLNRDFTGGIRILTPYKALASDWFIGNADAVQQNFAFIKRGNPENVLILSGDHIYTMDYRSMLKYHLDNKADMTIATVQVPLDEASRYGILNVDQNQQVTDFIEKPQVPESNIANMGVYLFKCDVLNEILWADHFNSRSKHDFGKDIIPELLTNNKKVFAYPFDGYWVDVGTIETYWKSQMELLLFPHSFRLYRPDWIIHTRTEERPPVLIKKGAIIENSLLSDGCIIETGAVIRNSILSPGIHVESNALIDESILFTDCCINQNANIYRTIADKRVQFGKDCKVGCLEPTGEITIIGKDSKIPAGIQIQAGALVGTDVTESDFNSDLIKSNAIIQTKRLPNEI